MSRLETLALEPHWVRHPAFHETLQYHHLEATAEAKRYLRGGPY